MERKPQEPISIPDGDTGPKRTSPPLTRQQTREQEKLNREMTSQGEQPMDTMQGGNKTQDALMTTQDIAEPFPGDDPQPQTSTPDQTLGPLAFQFPDATLEDASMLDVQQTCQQTARPTEIPLHPQPSSFDERKAPEETTTRKTVLQRIKESGEAGGLSQTSARARPMTKRTLEKSDTSQGNAKEEGAGQTRRGTPYLVSSTAKVPKDTTLEQLSEAVQKRGEINRQQTQAEGKKED